MNRIITTKQFPSREECEKIAQLIDFKLEYIIILKSGGTLSIQEKSECNEVLNSENIMIVNMNGKNFEGFSISLISEEIMNLLMNDFLGEDLNPIPFARSLQLVGLHVNNPSRLSKNRLI